MELTNNPYAPPKTRELELPVADVPDRSEHVEWACKLMWIGFSWSILSSLLAAFAQRGMPGQAVMFIARLIGLAIALAIVYWFTNKLSAGRNWMRLLITILNVIGVAIIAIALVIVLSRESGTAFLSGMFEAAPIPMVSMLVQSVFGACETILINTPSSRDWFAAKQFAH